MFTMTPSLLTPALLQLGYTKKLGEAPYQAPHYPADSSCFPQDSGTAPVSNKDAWCSFQKQVSKFWNHSTNLQKEKPFQPYWPPRASIAFSIIAALRDTKGPGLPGLALRLRASVEAKQGNSIDVAEFDQKIIARRERFVSYHQAMTKKPTEEFKKAFIKKHDDTGSIDFDRLSKKDLETLFTLSLIAEFLRGKQHEGLRHAAHVPDLKGCDILESHAQKCSDCNSFDIEVIDLLNAVSMGHIVRWEPGIPEHSTLIVELESQDFVFFDNAKYFLKANYFADKGVAKEDVHPLPPWTIIASAFSDLGILLESQGNLNEAEKHYRKALEINPKYARAHYNWGTLFYLHGDFTGAEKHYRKALEINPNDVMAHNALAILLDSQGNLNEAEKHFRKALEINPNDAMTHNNLGILLASQGNLNEAEKHYRKVLEIKLKRAYIDSGLANLIQDQRLDFFQTR